MEPRRLAVGHVDVAGVVVVGDDEAGGVRGRDRRQAVGPRQTAVLGDGQVDVVPIGPTTIPGEVDDVVRSVIAHRPREARIAGAERGVRAVRQAAVRRPLNDHVAGFLLVVAEKNCVVVDERHPLPVGAAAFVRDAAAKRATGGEVVPVVGRRGGHESGQRAQPGIRVLEVALRVSGDARRRAAVTAAARSLLASRRRTEQMELITSVGRDLGVVRRVREAGRAAGVDVAGCVDRDQRLGLVALQVGGSRSRELQPLRRGRRKRLLGGARRGRDLELARIGLRRGVDEAAGENLVGAGRKVETDDLFGRARSVARPDLVAVWPDDGEDLVGDIFGPWRDPRDREGEGRVDGVVRA